MVFFGPPFRFCLVAQNEGGLHGCRWCALSSLKMPLVCLVGLVYLVGEVRCYSMLPCSSLVLLIDVVLLLLLVLGLAGLEVCM